MLADLLRRPLEILLCSAEIPDASEYELEDGIIVLPNCQKSIGRRDCQREKQLKL